MQQYCFILILPKRIFAKKEKNNVIKKLLTYYLRKGLVIMRE